MPTMARNMSGVEVRATSAGRKALESGQYGGVDALPPRMKQYRVSRRVQGQRLRTPFCPTVALAEQEYAALLERAGAGVKVGAATARLLLGQYAEQWLERRQALVDAGALSSSTVDNNAVQLRAYAIPELGYRPLTALTGDEILAWRSGLKARDGKPLAEASKVKATAALSTMLSDAVDDGILERSPMRKRSGRAAVPRAKQQSATNLYLEPRQLLRLADASQDYWLMVLVAGLCGLRISECIALTSESVLGNGDLVVSGSADRSGKIKATKTYETRTVRMPATVSAPMLRLAHSLAPGERLFRGSRGGALSRTNYRTRYFAVARDAAATAVSSLQALLRVQNARPGYFCDETAGALVRTFAEPGEVGPREWHMLDVDGPLARTTLRPGDRDFSTEFTFHDLRHTAASLAISSGANIKAVQQMLGHRTAAVTLDTYAGLFESDRVATAEGIERLMASA